MVPVEPSCTPGTPGEVETETLRQEILDLLSRRDPSSSICPSEVARHVADDWRALMTPVRRAAAGLADDGVVEVTQAGEPVDVRSARGPVRIRRGPTWPDVT